MPTTINWISHRVVWAHNTPSTILLSPLSSMDISGIEEQPDGLTIFYQDETLTAEIKVLCDILQLDVKHEISSSPDQNWNSIWESSFQPVVVDDFCIIYAHFHKIDKAAFEHAIQITPQMSFGTGHHATTRMMISLMRKLNFKDKSVFDFGSGTGILTILASLLGAQDARGIDNVSWAVENSRENAIKNNVSNIHFSEADHAYISGQIFDIVLVNIIRKVIFDNLDVLAKQTAKSGQLLLSGFLQNDRQKMIYETTQRGFQLVEELTEDQWVCQLYQKTSD